MSSERSLRCDPAGSRRSRPPRPSPSLHRRTPAKPKSSMPIDILHKSLSEPLLTIEGPDIGDDDRSLESDGGWIHRSRTCSYVFPYQPFLSASLMNQYEGHPKDAKVVVTVTVEGSPGPIRTMVKTGSSVEDTIKLVIEKYGEEGRSPRLDKNAASFFDLHLSYFSLESLDRSNTIGNVGSRNFYLRKSIHKSIGDKLDAASNSFTSEIVCVEESLPQTSLPVIFLPVYITRRITRSVRKVGNLWKIFGCI
ncbi:hypothetical protein Nepgr_011323 [Nepenthes gracilis]|uniref:DUF7054 domain-containing protein n=1 Tax=Nepenthes gracilis TaxID=150966 RepID=A0AAD3SF41_NEPGR|nr:hypothetical protein Nepgr_011323 [Nepenthes gracilis]